MGSLYTGAVSFESANLTARQDLPAPPPPDPVVNIPLRLIIFYRRLVSMSRQRGHTWGKSRNVAEKLGVSLRTFRYRVRDLKAINWITTTKNGRELFIWPLAQLPAHDESVAAGRRVPRPQVAVPPVAHLVAHPQRRFAHHNTDSSVTHAMHGRQRTSTDSVQSVASDIADLPHAVVVSHAARPVEKNSLAPDVTVERESLPVAAVEIVSDGRVAEKLLWRLAGLYGWDRVSRAIAVIVRYSRTHVVRNWPAMITAAVTGRWLPADDPDAARREQETERTRRHSVRRCDTPVKAGGCFYRIAAKRAIAVCSDTPLRNAEELTAERQRLRTDEPDVWAALVESARAMLSPPVRNCPTSPGYPPALDAMITKILSERFHPVSVYKDDKQDANM